jgi:hypothetical protein
MLPDKWRLYPQASGYREWSTHWNCVAGHIREWDAHPFNMERGIYNKDTPKCYTADFGSAIGMTPYATPEEAAKQVEARALATAQDIIKALAVAEPVVVDAITVRIDERLIGRIGVREWGLPSLCVPGKMWRSEKNGTISCMLARGTERVAIETLPLLVVKAGDEQWMPDEWRAALWEYAQSWPACGCKYGPFFAITEAERCDFIRDRAKELVASDNIGCRLIAHGIGQLAAVDYEIIEPEPPLCQPTS